MNSLKRQYCLSCYGSGRIVTTRTILYITKSGIPVVKLKTKKCETCQGEGFVWR